MKHYCVTYILGGLESDIAYKCLDTNNSFKKCTEKVLKLNANKWEEYFNLFI